MSQSSRGKNNDNHPDNQQQQGRRRLHPSNSRFPDMKELSINVERCDKLIARRRQQALLLRSHQSQSSSPPEPEEEPVFAGMGKEDIDFYLDVLNLNLAKNLDKDGGDGGGDEDDDVGDQQVPAPPSKANNGDTDDGQSSPVLWDACVLWDPDVKKKLEEHEKEDNLMLTNRNIGRLMSSLVTGVNSKLDYRQPFLLLDVVGPADSEMNSETGASVLQVVEKATEVNSAVPVSHRLWNLELAEPFALLGKEMIRKLPTTIMLWGARLQPDEDCVIGEEPRGTIILDLNGSVRISTLIFHCEEMSRERIRSIQGDMRSSELGFFYGGETRTQLYFNNQSWTFAVHLVKFKTEPTFTTTTAPAQVPNAMFGKITLETDSEGSESSSVDEDEDVSKAFHEHSTSGESPATSCRSSTFSGIGELSHSQGNEGTVDERGAPNAADGTLDDHNMQQEQDLNEAVVIEEFVDEPGANDAICGSSRAVPDPEDLGNNINNVAENAPGRGSPPPDDDSQMQYLRSQNIDMDVSDSEGELVIDESCPGVSEEKEEEGEQNVRGQLENSDYCFTQIVKDL